MDLFATPMWTMRASTRAYKIHIVVKNVLICTPYPQSHIQRLEATTGFAGLVSLDSSIPAAGFSQFRASAFRVEFDANLKAKTTHTHSMILRRMTPSVGAQVAISSSFDQSQR